MKKMFIILSLITLCSCGQKQEKTITPQKTNYIEVQETEQKEDVMSEAEYKGKCKEVTFKELSEDKDAMKGDMLYNLTLDDVRMMLIDELKPKQDADYEEDEEINEEEIYEEDR